MELNTSLPSYAVIDGRRVKIWHTGQKRTCARCNQEAVNCPGSANARDCEQNGGIKTKTEEMWMKVLQNVSYQEWNGEETKRVIEETGDIEFESEPSTQLVDCDSIVLSNIEESVEEEVIKDLIKVECNIDVNDDVKVEIIGKNKRSRLIVGLPMSSIGDICKILNRKLFWGKIIHCKPRVPCTPPRANPTNKSPKKDGGPTNIIPGLVLSKSQRKKLKKKEMRTETKDLEEDFVFSEEELIGEDEKDDENSDDFRTPVKSKEFVESMSVPAQQVKDLVNKRSRPSPEEIRGYKKSKSGSNGNEQVQKISTQE